jgi:DNA-nicking Smr family endonuclease
MKTLDLHGLQHDQAESAIINFIALNEMPVQIVTGKSERMRRMVMNAAQKTGHEWHYQNWTNAGCLVITEI